MAEFDRIQRVPRGLNELLSLVGGKTPTSLDDSVQPTIDLLQFYGLTQRRVVAATNGALGSGTTLAVTLPGANWNVLFGCSFAVNGNAAYTTCMIQLRVNGLKVAFYNVPNPAVALESSIQFTPPTPWLLEPGSVVEGFLQTAGFATGAVAIQALAAPLG